MSRPTRPIPAVADPTVDAQRELRRRARGRRFAIRYIAIAALAVAVYYLLPNLPQQVLYELVGLSSVIAILYGIHLHRPANENAWLWIACSQLLFVLGDAIFDTYDLFGMTPPLPSPADGLYLAGYPPLAIGVYMLLPKLNQRLRIGTLVDAWVTTIAGSLLLWLFLVKPQGAANGHNLAAQLTAASYPLMDVLVFAVLLRLLYTGGMRNPAYRLLTASVALLFVADVLFTVGELNGTYASSSPANAGWLLAYAAIGAAALHPSMGQTLASENSERLGRLRIAAFGAALALPALALIVKPKASLDIAIALVAIAMLVLTRLSDLTRLQQRHNDELAGLIQLKATILHSVSHDLRTPLTAIVGYADLLEDEATPDQLPMLKTISRSAARLQHMVEDILLAADIDRTDAPLVLHRAPLSPGALAKASLETVTPLATRAGITLSIDAEPTAEINADALRVSQVLDNLITNAVKFSRNGGAVSVRVRNDEEGSVRFEVEDSGIGIAADELPNVFTSFHRAQNAEKSAIGGSGLGLYITQSIVAAHGGTITIASTLDVGTTVTLRLPLQATPALLVA